MNEYEIRINFDENNPGTIKLEVCIPTDVGSSKFGVCLAWSEVFSPKLGPFLSQGIDVLLREPTVRQAFVTKYPALESVLPK